MMEGDVGGDSTNPSVESEPIRDVSSSETRVDSASVQFVSASDNSTAGVESGGRAVAEGSNSIDSVSAEGTVSDVNNRAVGELNSEVCSDKRGGSVKRVKSEQKKVPRRKELKLKESTLPGYDSMITMFDEFAANGSVAATEDRSPMGVVGGHGFEVGDMVWGKVKSHPWWPGHIFSEKFATQSVRRSKRDGLLLVAFFGDSSYGWFDPSELIPFDSNFAEKSRQTYSKAFVKAVEEAMDEVSRRSALGLSCMCRNKQNFRQTDVQGYLAVDVTDYEPGAVYSIDAIEKARSSFQPSSALDFVRLLALEPTGSDYGGVDFIKNKAKVVSYRRAIYEEFDDTYAQAFGYDSVDPSSGSVQEQDPRKTPSKAPLSGRQVFADTSGKGKSSAKPIKLKDHVKKDKYLFKRREEPKEVKTHQVKEKDKVTSSSLLGHIEDDVAISDGDYVLQKRVSATIHDELPSKGSGANMEDTPVVVGFGDPGFQTIKSQVVNDSDDDKMNVSQMEDKKTSSDLVVDKFASDRRAVTQNDAPSSRPHKTVATENTDDRPKKVQKLSKRPVGEMGSSEKKKKRKKEQAVVDGTGKVPLVDKERVLAKKPFQSSILPVEDPHETNNIKPITSHTSGTKDVIGLANNETELPLVLGDLLSLALDPFHAINRGKLVKTRQVFLKFRSLVFQKSLNLSSASEDDEGNGTHSSKFSENGIGVTPVKSQSTSSGRPDDPTIGGRKRGPSDRQEEIAARKKKKVGDIRNLTKEKKVIKKIDEPPAPVVKQPVVKTLKKPGVESIKKTEQRAPPVPTMLIIKFPQGGSLPSTNELKARFARFGPMDHSATRIYWNTFACRVVYRYKAHAQAAHRFVINSGSLFGNTDVKCTLKEIGGDTEPPPAVKVPKEDNQPGLEDRPPPSSIPAASGVQLKSILKKSGGEEAAGNGGRGRVKFMLGGEENQVKNSMENKNGASSFSKSTHSTMDINSKNFQKAVLQSSTNPLPLLPLPTTTSVVSSTTQLTRPPQPQPQPPSSMHYATPLAPPPRLPPPPSLTRSGAKTPPAVPNIGPPKVDISHQMLSLLTKCNEVVTNVTNMFGYVPYRPL